MSRKNHETAIDSAVIEITPAGEMYSKIDLSKMKATNSSSSQNQINGFVVYANDSKEGIKSEVTLDYKTGAMDYKVILPN